MITRPGAHYDPLPGLRTRLAGFGIALTAQSNDARRRLIAWIVLSLVALNALMWGMAPADGTSTAFGPTILGLPLVSMGGVATGWIAFGGLAVGVVAIGGGAVGVISFGGLALGLVFGLGGGAIGYYATGGLALGGYAYAGNGVARGRYAAQGAQSERLIGG